MLSGRPLSYELPSFRYTHLFTPYESDRNGKSCKRDAPGVTSLAESMSGLRLYAKDVLVSYLRVLCLACK
jgi:hypothetical protein